MKSKLSTAKKSKTTTFSRVFRPKKNRQFSREIKVEFSDKKWRFRTVCPSRLDDFVFAFFSAWDLHFGGALWCNIMKIFIGFWGFWVSITIVTTMSLSPACGTSHCQLAKRFNYSRCIIFTRDLRVHLQNKMRIFFRPHKCFFATFLHKGNVARDSFLSAWQVMFWLPGFYVRPL